MNHTSSPAPPRAGRREWCALGVLMLPVLLIAVDSTVLGFAVPMISSALRPTGTQLLWMVDIYMFVLAGLLVTMGTLGDRIGRRRLLLVGAAGFGAASVLAGYAPTAEVLIVARALLGVFGATLMPSTLSLLRTIFLDRRQRTLAIAIWATMFSGGAALGPVVGGWLLEHFWWGSVFLINLPVMAALLVGGRLLLPEYRDPAPGPFDLLSAGMSLATVLPVVYGIKLAASEGLGAAPVASVLLGLAVGALFVRRQLRARHPMLDLRLFADREFSTALSANLMSVFALTGCMFFITQYLQLVLGVSPMRAGLWLLPGILASIAAGLLSVALVRRLPVRVLVPAGMFAATAGFLVMTQLPATGTPLLLVIAFALVGAGVGLAETLTNDVIMASAPPERAGAASAISETAYELGGALGTAVLGSLVVGVYQSALAPAPGLPPAALAEARETLGGAHAVADGLAPAAGEALRQAAGTAFTGAIHITALVGAVVVGYAALQTLVLLRRAARAAEARRAERPRAAGDAEPRAGAPL
ncbi:MFS transporter [Allonocardiopsis opalescens]|uniref:DHA2 family multidrug resistance protein-like MFS transporter n=1 Tax=Allonocardiopsis opalescens TaxID=1144618 RepID=A0A2T0PXE0_9ACTN|nr:MFS transporter [Allonocardiopsis opalescens]PRX96199.1 DHA2 family multidrug resistance protein-like MFS transporter [Allonocardiopsis opalescens]